MRRIDHKCHLSADYNQDIDLVEATKKMRCEHKHSKLPVPCRPWSANAELLSQVVELLDAHKTETFKDGEVGRNILSVDYRMNNGILNSKLIHTPGAMPNDLLVKTIREGKAAAEAEKVKSKRSVQLDAEIERQTRMAILFGEDQALVEQEGFLYRSGFAVNGAAAGTTAASVSPTSTIETTARHNLVFCVGDALKSGASVNSTLDSTNKTTSVAGGASSNAR